jgi:hypothetical protein
MQGECKMSEPASNHRIHIFVVYVIVFPRKRFFKIQDLPEKLVKKKNIPTAGSMFRAGGAAPRTNVKI